MRPRRAAVVAERMQRRIGDDRVARQQTSVEVARLLAPAVPSAPAACLDMSETVSAGVLLATMANGKLAEMVLYPVDRLIVLQASAARSMTSPSTALPTASRRLPDPGSFDRRPAWRVARSPAAAAVNAFQNGRSIAKIH